MALAPVLNQARVMFNEEPEPHFLAVEFAHSCEHLSGIDEEMHWRLVNSAWQVAVFLEAAMFDDDVADRRHHFRLALGYYRETAYYFQNAIPVGTRRRLHSKLQRLGASIAILSGVCDSGLEVASDDGQSGEAETVH